MSATAPDNPPPQALPPIPSDPAAVFIHIDNLSLQFILYRNKGMQLKEMVVERLGYHFKRLLGRTPARIEHKNTFYAIRHLTLAIHAGMRLGVVGANGAGKTSLLRTLARIYAPTEGRILLNGNVAALIEIGSGFDPELNAYENIMLGGALLGRTVRSMRERTDAIIEFAGIREFADVPIKYYSTGMNLRLAFALATDIEPEILLLDELFAGGDREFQMRAIQRMTQLVKKTQIMVMVSHDMGLVREFCTHTLWMEHGRMRMFGETREVLAAYTGQPLPAATAPVPTGS